MCITSIYCSCVHTAEPGTAFPEGVSGLPPQEGQHPNPPPPQIEKMFMTYIKKC